jgi:uncharacterized protein (DUF1697 family)
VRTCIRSGNVVFGSRKALSLLDRLAGSPVTARNWRTVLRIVELARPSDG